MMSPTVATIIGGCIAVIMASVAAIAIVIWRARRADDEPTEIGSDYLPADPLHRRDMQGW